MEIPSIDALENLLRDGMGQLWTNLCGPAHAHPATVAALDVDSDWVLAEWEREFCERLLLQAQGGTVRFVESRPGGGRSHFLALLSLRAARRGISILRLSPSEQTAALCSPLGLYRLVVQGMVGPATGESLGLAGLAKSPAVLEAAQRELYPECPQWGLALEMWCHEGEARALKFLEGQSVKSSPGFGLHSGLAEQDGFRALRCLLLFLRYAGFPGLLVTADGCGEIGYDRAPLEALRNLIDVCATGQLPGFMLVAAVCPGFRQELVPEYAALQQRLRGGFGLGAGVALNPILVVEEVRQLRQAAGLDFWTELGEKLLSLGMRHLPHLQSAPQWSGQGLSLLLQAQPPGVTVRAFVQTVARWLSQERPAGVDSWQLESAAEQAWAPHAG